MKKYRATSWGAIDAHEVVHETSKTIVFQCIDIWGDGTFERKERKDADSHRWFDSWADAKSWLVANAERDVKNARRNLKSANDHLGNVKGMRQKPEVA